MERITPPIHGNAQELLDIWERMASRHVSLGSSCACGIGGVTLQLQDFEQDIADFLLGQAERTKRSDVVEFLQTHGVDQDSGVWNIGRLLSALAELEQGESSEVATLLLDKLGKTLRSFEKLHG